MPVADLHDANLNSIELLKDDRIKLGLSDDENKTRHVIFAGVKSLICNNFREGNIVFEMDELPFNSIDKNIVESVLGISEGDSSDYVKKILSEIHSGSLKIIRIRPSYGADIIILCEGFTLE